MTSPIQVANWVNPQQQVMPVRFKLKKDEPTTGLELADVQRAVAYAKDAFPTAKFPKDAFIAVSRDAAKPEELDSYINTSKKIYHFTAKHKKDSNALFAIFTKMGRYMRDNTLPAFAGRAVVKPQPQALTYRA